ncbi:MAG: phage tail tape measure protein [Gammaproteobacteria bacterium]|nr:phage tail tape measure protein [Gammaproteobacteria bacterium]
MSSEIAIGVKIGATVGAAVAGFNSLGKSIKGLKNLTENLEREHAQLGSAIDSSMNAGKRATEQTIQQYYRLGTVIDKLKAKQLSLGNALNKRKALADERGELKGKILGTAGIAMTAAAPVKAAIDFESAMADVKKVVNFDTPQQFKQMQNDILGLTRKIPMAGDELAAIVAAGGQAGIARKSLLGFAGDAAKMGVAFDMAAGDAGGAMATMSNVLGRPIEKMSELGDAINHLSDNANAKARDIVNVINRAGVSMKTLGLSDNQTAAMSSTLLSMGRAPDVAAQAMIGMGRGFKQLRAGKHSKELAKLGWTTKSFAKALENDAQKTLLQFIDRLKTLPKAQRDAVSSKIFNERYAESINLMTENVTEYRRQLQLLQDTDAQGNPKYIGSMTREFENRSATTANNLTLLKNSVVELGVRLGSALLPTINSTVNAFKPVIYTVSELVETHPKLVKGIMGVVAAFASYKVASLGVRFGMNLMLTSGNELFILANKISGGWLKTNIILGRTKFATALASGGFRGLARSVLASSAAMLANPIGLVIAGIAVAGTLIYKYWQPIKAFVSGFFEGIASACQPIQPLITGIANAFGAIWNFLSPVVTPVIGFFKDLFSFEQVAEGGARQLGQSFGQAIGGAINSVIGFFSNMWTSVTGFFNSGIANITATIINWSPIGLFHQAFTAVLSWFGIELPAKFTNFGKNIVDGIGAGITNGAMFVQEKIIGIGTSIKTWFMGVLGINSPSRVFAEFGTHLMQGLINGLSAMLGKVREKIVNIGSSVTNWFKEKLGIHSPSRVFMQLGGFVSEGLGIGIEQMAKSPLNATQKIAQAIGNTPMPSLARPFVDIPNPNKETIPQGDTQAMLQYFNGTGANQGNATLSGINVTFSPNINVTGTGNDDGIAKNVQQAITMSLTEFERMMNEVLDQRSRRSYI